MGEDYYSWDQEEIESEDRQMRAAARRVYPQKADLPPPEYFPTRVVVQSDVTYGVCEDCGEPIGKLHSRTCPVLEKPTITVEQARAAIREAKERGDF